MKWIYFQTDAAQYMVDPGSHRVTKLKKALGQDERGMLNLFTLLKNQGQLSKLRQALGNNIRAAEEEKQQVPVHTDAFLGKSWSGWTSYLKPSQKKFDLTGELLLKGSLESGNRRFPTKIRIIKSLPQETNTAHKIVIEIESFACMSAQYHQNTGKIDDSTIRLSFMGLETALFSQVSNGNR